MLDKLKLQATRRRPRLDRKSRTRSRAAQCPVL